MFVAKKGDKWFSFLMDGEPALEVVLSNAEALDADLMQTRAIFLSLGHSGLIEKGSRRPLSDA